MNRKASLLDAGTHRSTIGKERNRRPASPEHSASFCSSRLSTSSGVSRETTSSTPDLRQPVSSSSSQSPPRGRAEMASFTGQRPPIQGNPVYIGILQPSLGLLFLFDLPRQRVHIHATAAQKIGRAHV